MTQLITNSTSPSGACQENSKKTLETETNSLFVTVPHLERAYRQYLAIKSSKESDRALYRYHCFEQLLALTPKGQEVIAYLFMLHRKHRIINPTQGTIATEVGCSIQTVRRALNDAKSKGIIDWDSGRWERRANVYKFSSYFYARIGKKYALNAIGHLVKMLAASQCSTYIEYNARKHKLTISEMVNHSLEIDEGHSPEEISSPSETIHFLHSKSGKVRVSVCDIPNTTASTPPGTVTNKISRKPESSVLYSGILQKQAKNAILDKKGDSMSNEALNVLKDLENENLNKRQRTANRGSGRMCGAMLRDLRLSILYHFGRGYRHNKEDRLFSREHTTFLRKKYNL